METSERVLHGESGAVANVTLRRCSKCGEEKPPEAYPKRGNACRACVSACHLEWIRKNREHVREWERNWVGKNREKRNRQIYEYAKLNPEKKSARDAVSALVRAGKMPKPSSLDCLCGAKAEEYHHHMGYDKANRLNVIPLCRSCHGKAHSS